MSNRPSGSALVAAALNLVLCEDKRRAEQVFRRMLQDYGYLNGDNQPTAKAHRMRVRPSVILQAPRHFASGVYVLDLSTNGGQPDIRRDDNDGDLVAEINYRRITNPQDPMPEQVLLQFREIDNLPPILSDRPNLPIQITVEFNLKKE